MDHGFYLRDQAIVLYNTFFPMELGYPIIFKNLSLVLKPFKFLGQRIFCTKVARLKSNQWFKKRRCK
jgi:hypothetical protein